MKNDFEIVIIGGGPAGSSSALYLNEYGFDVCLIEKKIFPRETLCGEFLSVEVFKAIKEFGLEEEFLALNPNNINSFRFINNNGDEFLTKFDFSAYALKRSKFDYLLLSAAQKRGVEVFQPAEVKSIIKTKSGFTLLINSNSENVQLNARHVIAAYGKQNIIDKHLHRRFINEYSKLNGIKFHVDAENLKEFNKNEICLYAADGIYCGVNAVSQNVVTLCFLEDRNKVPFSPRDQLLNLQSKNKQFGNLFNDRFYSVLNDLPVYGTGNIYFGKKELVKDGIFMVGDAAGVIAPFAGDGIGMAIETSALLSEILNSNKKGKINDTDLENLYKLEWNKKFKKRLITAFLIQKILLNNFLRNAGVKTAGLVPYLSPFLVKATRS